jgi:hypothetical protein
MFVRLCLAACAAVLVMLIVVLRLLPGCRQLRTLYLPPVPLLDSSDALDVVVASPPMGAPVLSGAVSGVAVRPPLPSSGVPCCSVWVLLPRWSRCIRLSAPPCAHISGPRVSAVRRPFSSCFISLSGDMGLESLAVHGCTHDPPTVEWF